jgi:hypothetical protein
MRSDASYPRGGVRLLTASAAVLAALGSATWLGGQQKEPYYVGTRVCASCHDGQEMGAQHSLWLLTGHARAYASLATPESLRIAELSGVPGDPQKAATCLGCHATASEAEEWEKDPTFRMEDGVQCEKCHGPGSEYMPDEVMRSREASARAGLIWPKKESCNLCHYVKGSHVKVHHKKPLDLDEAMAKIAHPTRDPSPGVLSGLDPAETGSPDEPRYIGVHTCAGCHSGPERGHQYSRWRLSRHSRAYAILSSEAALEMARAMGIPGDPQRAPECLRCHSTGGVGESKGVLETFSPDEGVGCEACHGPGSHYAVEAIMMDRGRAHASGLQEVTKETCLRWSPTRSPPTSRMTGSGTRTRSTWR